MMTNDLTSFTEPRRLYAFVLILLSHKHLFNFALSLAKRADVSHKFL